MALRFDPVAGTFYDPGQTKTGQIIVRAVSQLAGTLLSDKVYFIDNQIDMGSQSIEVPEGGLTIEGHGYDISKLYSTANSYTMFTTPSGGYAGNLTLNRNTLYVTGTSSKIFDIDNDGNSGALEMNTVNLGDFPVTTPSLGEVANYRQVRTSNFAAIKYTQGLTFSGDFGGIAINDAIILSPVAASTFLIEGTALTIADGMSSDMNALRLTGTMEWCDFADTAFTAPAKLALTNFRTQADDAVPNIDSKDPVALFKGCTGIDNTFIGAAWTLTTEAATSVATANVAVKLAGTTTASLDAWFDTNASNNRLRYIGTKVIKIDINGYMLLASAGTESYEVLLRQWDSSASSWIELFTAPLETALKLVGTRRGATGIVATAVVAENDYIEVWVQNVTNTANPTLMEHGALSISERQS